MLDVCVWGGGHIVDCGCTQPIVAAYMCWLCPCSQALGCCQLCLGCACMYICLHELIHSM
jgi:hypothetical protein